MSAVGSFRLAVATFFLAFNPVYAAQPLIAIIIDDIGHRSVEGRQAIELPGPVACAFLPHTPHAVRLAQAAHAAGKEVLLHLPLEPLEEVRLNGPGILTLAMSRGQFERALADNLAAVPHISGVNNHMGSLLTQHPGHMGWLMQALRDPGLYFVDSVTTEQSIAFQMALEHDVPTTQRDVFLDRDPDPDAIQQQLGKLKTTARKNGSALGIAHPFPETIAILRDALPELDREGFRLVGVAELIDYQTNGN